MKCTGREGKNVVISTVRNLGNTSFLDKNPHFLDGAFVTLLYGRLTRRDGS